MKLFALLLLFLAVESVLSYPDCKTIKNANWSWSVPEQECQPCEILSWGCLECEPVYYNVTTPFCLKCNAGLGYQEQPVNTLHFQSQVGDANEIEYGGWQQLSITGCICQNKTSPVNIYYGMPFLLSCYYRCDFYYPGHGCSACIGVTTAPQYEISRGNDIILGCLQCFTDYGFVEILRFNRYGDWVVVDCKCPNSSYYFIYLEDHDQCRLCNTSIVGCLTCSNSSWCLTCDPDARWNATPNAQGRCSCAAPYSLSNDGLTCEQSLCPAGCLSCPDPLLCSQCDEDNNWQLDIFTGQCVCKSGFVLSGNTCVPCSNFMSGCIQCSSQTNCSGCNTTTTQNFVLNSSSAQCDCKDTFYPSLLTSGPYPTAFSCQPCSQTTPHCLSCKSATNCTRCEDGYAVDSNAKCSPCNTQIVGCQNCSTLSSCNKCDSTALFVLSSNNCVCTSSYYFNTVTQSCTPCMTGCVSCTNASVCLACAQTHALTPGRVCDLCNVAIPGCTKCSSQTQCSECDQSLGFTYSALKCFCPLGRYINNVSKTCDYCNQTSLTNCVNCDSATYCTSCSNRSYVLYQVSSTQQTCRHCNVTLSGCLECSTDQNCTVCDVSKSFRRTAAFQCVCETGYFLNAIAGECQLCRTAINGCLQCTNSTFCTQCDFVNNFKLDIVVGQCSCKQSYYLNSTNQCHRYDSIPGCASYSNQTYCSYCGPNAFNYRGKCECMDGYYLDVAANQCKICSDPRCTVCIGQTQCNACQPFYRLVNNQTCVACGKLCKSCNATHCLECNTYSNNKLNKSQCECSSETFYDAGSNSCKKCSTYIDACLSCLSATQCIACTPDRLNWNYTCSICAPGYYLKTGQCLKCDSNCMQCEGEATRCTSCERIRLNILKGNKCECKLENDPMWPWAKDTLCLMEDAVLVYSPYEWVWDQLFP